MSGDTLHRPLPHNRPTRTRARQHQLALLGWTPDYFDPHTNVVESHISRLRAKIDKGHAVSLIQTLRGAGYSLREAAP